MYNRILEDLKTKVMDMKEIVRNSYNNDRYHYVEEMMQDKLDEILSLLSTRTYKTKPYILYKEGHEGGETLEDVKGIVVPMLNGQECLIWPKYKTCQLLTEKSADKWNAPERSEIEALRETTQRDSYFLLETGGSPAMDFVRGFGEQWRLPTLPAAMEITARKLEIDNLVRKIEGADLFGTQDFPGVWSASRRGIYDAWYSNGGNGFAGGSNMYYWVLVVPCIIL